MKKIILIIVLIIITLAWCPWVTQSFVEKAVAKNNSCPAQISSLNKKMFGSSLTADCGLSSQGIARVKLGFVTFWGSFMVTAVSK